MSSNESIRPITYLKTNSADLIKEVEKNRKPIIISQNGEAKAVIQNMASFREQKNAMLLLKIAALGEHEIKTSDIFEQSTVFSKLNQKFNSQ